MPLITDRDLLVIEPTLFTDASSVGTMLLSATDASVSGTELTSASSDFEAKDIGEDNVAVVDGKPVEVVARLQPTKLDVSLPRASKSDEKIEPGDGSNLSLQVLTFIRMIDRIETAVLQALGISAADPVEPLDASAILNPEAIRPVLALRTISEAFGSAAAVNPTDESLRDRASLYARRASEAARRAAVRLDLDGDGQPDATRHLEVVTFLRS